MSYENGVNVFATSNSNIGFRGFKYLGRVFGDEMACHYIGDYLCIFFILYYFFREGGEKRS